MKSSSDIDEMLKRAYGDPGYNQASLDAQTIARENAALFGMGDMHARDRADLATRIATAKNQTSADNFYASQRDESSAGAVVTRLKEANPSLAKWSDEELLKDINEIVDRGQGQINPAQAGALIQDSLGKTDDSFLGKIAKKVFDPFGFFADRSIDRSMMERRVDDIKSGKYADAYDEQKRLETTYDRMAAAQNIYNQEQANYNMFRQLAKNGDPRAVAELPIIEERLNEAKSVLAAAHQHQRTDPRSNMDSLYNKK